MIKLDKQFIEEFVKPEEIEAQKPFVKAAHQMIEDKTGRGNDFLGWTNVDTIISKEEIDLINKSAEKIRENSDVLLVIGIGGSYLGARAVIELLNNQFEKGKPEIIFVGQNMSATYLAQVTEYLKGKDFSINVISKSGTTLEPALAFRHFKNLLEEKYGEEAHQRIYATTDKEKGALKPQAEKFGWTSFVVPDDVGGRFSVLTAVGLLPIAASGIDIEELLAGAKNAQQAYTKEDLEENEAYQYAVIRQLLSRKGFTTEILVGYEPSLSMFIEWWKQLFAESEGKDHQGIFPCGAIFSTDLHSVGQYIQDGRRNLMETVIKINKPTTDIKIPHDALDLDELNYLADKTINFANECALRATAAAHVEGGVPNLILEVEKLDAFNLGELIYFFERAVALSGYLDGINPFNQPGVENYKKRMFHLLGKK